MKIFKCAKLLLYFLVILQNVGFGLFAPHHRDHHKQPKVREANPVQIHLEKKDAAGNSPQGDDDYDSPQMTSHHKAEPQVDDDYDSPQMTSHHKAEPQADDDYDSPQMTSHHKAEPQADDDYDSPKVSKGHKPKPQADDDYDSPQMTSAHKPKPTANDQSNEDSEIASNDETGRDENTNPEPEAEPQPQNTETQNVGNEHPPENNILIVIPNGNFAFQKQIWGPSGPFIYTNLGASDNESNLAGSEGNQNNVMIVIPPPRPVLMKIE